MTLREAIRELFTAYMSQDACSIEAEQRIEEWLNAKDTDDLHSKENV